MSTVQNSQGVTRRRGLGVVALAASGALLLSGCAGSQPSEAESSKFVLGVPVELPSANPYAANTGAGQMLYLSYFAYDPLINQTPSGEFASGLASEWEATESSATFTLREGVTCSDGTDLTAQQVADALNYVGNPDNQYPWVGGLTPTVPFTATGDDESGVISVELDGTFPFILETLGQVPVVCAAGLSDPASLDRSTVGTGPFVLDSASKTSYKYHVREGYNWGPDGASTDAKGTPEQLELRIVTDPTTAANELLAGNLTASKILGSDAQRVAEAGLNQTGTENLASSLWFTESPEQVTADPEVRRALVAAMDFGDLVKVHGLATGLPTERALSVRVGTPLVCSGANAEEVLPEFDQKAAGAMLDAAGWSVGADGIREKSGKKMDLTIAYGHEKDSSVAQLLASEWQGVGANATIKLLTTDEKMASINGVATFAVLIGASAMTLPSQFPPLISGPVPPEGGNNQQVSNPEYDRLVAAATSASLEDACGFWVEAENSIMGQADIVPIAQQESILFISKDANAEYINVRQPIPTSLKLNR